jgi:putative Holliday junction resolvase
VEADSQSQTIPERGRLLGIDFGTVRIGLAISDPSQMISSPLATYRRRQPRLDAQYFRELAEREQIVAMVVGLPVHLSGEESRKSHEAREFGQWLAAATGLPIAWVDERFSTSFAREMCAASELSGKKKKMRLDKLAAHVILGSYLESRRTPPQSRSIDDPH